MKLNKFVQQLQDLVDQGHGELEVIGIHGASGSCNELSNAFVQVCEECDEEMGCEVPVGENFICVYTGN